MVSVTKLVLDVLKPHRPNALEFAGSLAEVGSDCQVHLTVLEMDENTETLRVVIRGNALDFDVIQADPISLEEALLQLDRETAAGRWVLKSVGPDVTGFVPAAASDYDIVEQWIGETVGDRFYYPEPPVD